MRFKLFMVISLLLVSATGELHGADDSKELQILVGSNHFGEAAMVTVDVPSMQIRLFKKGRFLSPKWSPDGTKIIYSISNPYRIYVMNADGSGMPELIPTPHQANSPVWSPDGKRIAFTAIPEGSQPEIYIMNNDGRNPDNLSNHPEWDDKAAWSPDATTIAFTSKRDNKWRLFVMDIDGSNQRDLLNEDIYFGSSPTWSPDGEMIVFSKPVTGSSTVRTHVFVTSVDGAKTRQLTHNKAELNWRPVWSPNGRYIAYVSMEKSGEQKSPTGDLILFDVVSETSTKVLSGVYGWAAGIPAWKPLIKNGTEE